MYSNCKQEINWIIQVTKLWDSCLKVIIKDIMQFKNMISFISISKIPQSF